MKKEVISKWRNVTSTKLSNRLRVEQRNYLRKLCVLKWDGWIERRLDNILSAISFRRELVNSFTLMNLNLKVDSLKSEWNQAFRESLGLARDRFIHSWKSLSSILSSSLCREGEPCELFSTLNYPTLQPSRSDTRRFSPLPWKSESLNNHVEIC